MEPAELAKPEVARQFLILDSRSREDYEREHLLGARWVNHDAWKDAFGDGKEAGKWSRKIGQLGIVADATVAVYDD